MLEEIIFCDNCGLAVKPLWIAGLNPIIKEKLSFCNPKCEKSYKAKEQRILTKRHGKRENYGCKGI